MTRSDPREGVEGSGTDLAALCYHATMRAAATVSALAGIGTGHAHLRLLVLFGSQARGAARPGSDWDLGYLATFWPSAPWWFAAIWRAWPSACPPRRASSGRKRILPMPSSFTCGRRSSRHRRRRAACIGWNLGAPTSYADAFRRLAGAGVIDQALAERLARAAGFRSVVAHAYDDLDMHRVFRAASEGPRDLERFLAVLAARPEMVDGSSTVPPGLP